MDGVAFQGMPRIALTPAEEAMLPRPHSSASQVATAVPSAYTRTATSASPQGGSSTSASHSTSIPNSAVDSFSRPSTPGPGTLVPTRPSSPSIFRQSPSGILSSSSSSTSHVNLSSLGNGHHNHTATAPGEQEYPQNPQDHYFSQVPPPIARSSSPGPSRLAFALTSRPARSPSPQLYNNLYDPHHPYASRTPYFHRSSHDVQPRPGSPLQQEHQDSWENSIRMESPTHLSGSDEDETESDVEDEDDSEGGNNTDDEGDDGRKKQRRQKTRKQRPPTQRSNSKGILRRLRETTSRLSFGDDFRRSTNSRTSQESDRPARSSHEDNVSITSRSGKEVLQDMSDEERQQESSARKSRSSIWRPSLSLIRQESDSGGSYYLQNDPNRISGSPSSGHHYPSIELARPISRNSHMLGNNGNKDKKRRRSKGTSKSSKKKKRRAAKRRRAEQLAAQQRQQELYEQQLAEQARVLPELGQVLEKKTRYPLSYDDFEAFLRTQRAVEYLNFWADVTAHEQLCRTFDASERRQKREQQLEERALARDRRRMALMAAIESSRLTPDPDFVSATPGSRTGGSPASIRAGTGIGIGASGQEMDGPNLYAASRSSLQLPLHDHLSFPQESRRYGVQDSGAVFPPMPPSHPHYHGEALYSSGSYNRLLAGANGSAERRASGEGMSSRPSLEEAHISEQDAAVAAVALRAHQHHGVYSLNPSREDVRRGSFDLYHPMPTAMGGSSSLSSLRYQQNNSSGGYLGGALPSSYSIPNAYNLMMRGRGSVDATVRSTSRSSKTRLGAGGPAVVEDYFGNGARFSPGQHLQYLQTPQLIVQDDSDHAPPPGSSVEPGPGTKRNSLTLDNRLGGLDSSMHLQSLRRQISQQSIGFADQPELNRRPSIGRFGAGIGPLQAPVSIQRSGERAYTPSIFSMGQQQEGKALLAQSFRTIGLEDLLESTMRIYRKYLIQLRTASMAAEEEAAEAAAANASKGARDVTGGYLKRNSLEKTFAPGWDGYAEEVIAEWNEKWQERRTRRLSTRRSIAARMSDAYHQSSNQPSSAAGEEAGLTIDTKVETRGVSPSQEKNEDENQDEEDKEDENDDQDRVEEGKRKRGKSSAPTSPLSAKMKKRTGTGLSAMLNPLLTRLMRTEITVVELPTLTINTTTIEEATVPDDSAEDDDDDEDDDDNDDDDDEDDDDEDEEDEDYDSDEEDKDEEEGVRDKNHIIQREEDHAAAIQGSKNDGALQALEAKAPQDGVVILERSISSSSPHIIRHASNQNQHSTHEGLDTTATSVAATGASDAFVIADDLERGMGPHAVATVHRSEAEPPLTRRSSLSSLSSSWDRITKCDLQKQVTILPPPVNTSFRPTPYHRHRRGNESNGSNDLRVRTGAVAKSATMAAQKVGWQLSSLLRRSIRGTGSSSASLDVIQITPNTSPRMERYPNFRFQLPTTVVTEAEQQGNNGGEGVQKQQQGGQSTMITPTSGSDHLFVQQPQGNPIHSNLLNNNSVNCTNYVHNHDNAMSPSVNEEGTMLTVTGAQSSSLPPSTVSHPIASSTPPISPTPSPSPYHQHSGSSPAAVAASAAAAAFYLPLECRQRIHTQVREEGRTYAPHLYGPAKGFVMDVVLQDHYYPLFLKHMERHNLGLLTRHHPNNRLKKRGMIWLGVGSWVLVVAIQIMLVMMGKGGWSSPWVWVVGTIGGWTASVCLMTGVKGFSPVLGLLGKM
ncbi:hypothetical protein EDD11_007039 [Mortierella claussenii]|nr:hypothetical protein EDD11_007039 [Mortierella claussenii]